MVKTHDYLSHRFHRRMMLVGTIALASGAILAACGGETPSTAPATTAPTMPATTTTSVVNSMPGTSSTPLTPSSARKVMIEYWNINTDTLGGPAVAEIVKRFNDTTPNIAVVARPYPDYQPLLQALQAALAAKIPPAVAQVGYNYLNFAAKNLPHLTADEAAKRDAGGADFLKGFAPNVLDLGKTDGVQRGMPLAISNPVLYYNTDLLAKAGIAQPPRTWGEVRDAARILKEKTGTFGIYLAEPTNFFVHQGLVESNGARMLVGSGADRRTGIDSPEAIAAMQLAADMVLVDKTAAHLNNMQGIAAFTSGQIAMAVISIANREGIQRAASFPVGAASFPTFGSKPRRVPAGGNNLFIFAGDREQQAAAWEWIKFLLSPESLTTWVRGTGYLPPRTGIADDPRYLKPFFDANRLMKAATDQFPDTVSWVSWPGKDGVQAEQELVDTRNRILTGERDATTALREAAVRINGLIKE